MFVQSILCAVLVVGAAGHALAQTPPSGCATAAPPTVAATPPAQGSGSGTAPGGMGSTAWSGGTGGSFIGTNPQGPTHASPTEHPPVAKGLDPTQPMANNAAKC